MFWKSFGRYRTVYVHLRQTCGQSWQVRLSFVMNVAAQLAKLVALPIMISIIIARLPQGDFHTAGQAVLAFAAFSLFIGILSPLTKYIGILGEQAAYHYATPRYFQNLVESDIEYFNSNLAGYLTTATRQYGDSAVLFVRALRDRYLEE